MLFLLKKSSLFCVLLSNAFLLVTLSNAKVDADIEKYKSITLSLPPDSTTVFSFYSDNKLEVSQVLYNNFFIKYRQTISAPQLKYHFYYGSVGYFNIFLHSNYSFQIGCDGQYSNNNLFSFWSLIHTDKNVTRWLALAGQLGVDYDSSVHIVPLASASIRLNKEINFLLEFSPNYNYRPEEDIIGCGLLFHANRFESAVFYKVISVQNFPHSLMRPQILYITFRYSLF